MPRTPPQSTADASSEVDALLASLEHPCTVEIEVVRRIILATVPGVRESVKEPGGERLVAYLERRTPWDS